MTITSNRENLSNIEPPTNVSFSADINNTHQRVKNNSDRVASNNFVNPSTPVAHGTRSRDRQYVPYGCRDDRS